MIVDLTSFLKNELHGHSQPTQAPPSKISNTIRIYSVFTEDTYNSLIKIRNILTESRENYFSNASYSFEAFTDRQREELNQVIKKNLDQVSNQINELNEGLKKEVALISKTEKQHLKAAILCLFQSYKKIQTAFREFQMFSLKRKKKIEEYPLPYPSTIAIDKQSEKTKYKPPTRPSTSSSFTDESLQREAGILYVQKVREQSELKQTKEKIESLHEMMANMSNIVLQQELQTSGFLEIGQTGLFHIQRGNRNLVQANHLAKETGRIYSLIFYLMALSLLLFDFLKS